MDTRAEYEYDISNYSAVRGVVSTEETGRNGY
jgi:hypothetical protein